ncbi:MAG TPA: dipeptidase [Pirellulales bacterium]|jgi:membrane dipeptidase
MNCKIIVAIVALIGMMSLPLALAVEDATQTDKAADARPAVVLTDAARELHRSALVVDGHNDLPWQLRTKGESGFTKFDIAQPQPTLDTDLPRLKKGGVGAQFWSAYAPVETMRTGESAKVTLEQIDLIRRMIDRYPDDLELALTADDIVRIHKSGKIASLIGVEGGHAIDNSIASLRRLYDLGARYMTLAHSDSLDWVDSATDVPRSEGLSPFGEEVVTTMNDLGMLVDISHISADAMRDVLRVSRAPVIASHSSAFAVAGHPRNVPDDVLRGLPKNGGVIMVNFFSGFIVPERAELGARTVAERIARRQKDPAEKDEGGANAIFRSTAEQQKLSPGSVHTLVDHIDHIVKVAGIDHVGLGSDYDGVTKLPAQLEDVSTYPYITQELLNRGYKPDAIRKVLGENLVRALRQAEQVKK